MEVWRGNIWRADLSQYNTPGVQSGKRPVIIVQNDIGNKYSPVVSIISGTTKLKKDMKTHITLDERCGLEETTVFMAEQPQTISKTLLLFKIGQVPSDKMNDLDRAIMVQMGLVKPFDLDYIKELVADITEIDKFFSKYKVTERESNIRLRRIKELEHYCAEYGYDYRKVLDKYYESPKEVSMCG